MRWLYACKNPTWYYFIKREHAHAVTNKKFLSSVDEPIREFVRFLHGKNILTTPSCSGHNKSVKEFENIYSSLKEDKKKIKQKGLLLLDIETGEPHLFQDASYRLPWSRSEFILRIMCQQEKGILGLYLNGQDAVKENILQLKIHGVDIYEKDNIVFIYTQHSSRWSEITPAVKQIILDHSLIP